MKNTKSQTLCEWTSSCCSIYCRIQSAWDRWSEPRLLSSWRTLILTEMFCVSSLVLVDETAEGVQSSLATDKTPTEAPNANQSWKINTNRKFFHGFTLDFYKKHNQIILTQCSARIKITSVCLLRSPTWEFQRKFIPRQV